MDKHTLNVLRTIKLNVPQTFELAIQPGTRRSFVTVHDDNEGKEPEQLARRLYDVNESTGDVRKVPGVAGEWVLADPSRRRVFVGLHFVYEAGIILDFDIGDIRPDYGDVDVLENVDFEAAPGKVVVKTNSKAGGNGKCIRIAPDGRAVAFVSAVGTPQFSYAIPAFDPNEPSKILASYSMKEAGFAVDVAFHPCLPIVAGISEQSVRLFDRNTGDILKDKVDFGTFVPKDLPPRALLAGWAFPASRLDDPERAHAYCLPATADRDGGLETPDAVRAAGAGRPAESNPSAREPHRAAFVGSSRNRSP